MNSSKLTSLLKKHGDSLVASIAGFVIIYLFTLHGGIGISPDSIAYTGTARSLIGGNGFTLYNHPLVDFPVFYPFFLSVVMFFAQLDIILCAPVLNGLMFATVIFLSGCMMEHFINRSKWYKIILLAAIVTSPSLIEIYSMLWSETLFIIWSLLFFFALQNYYRTHSIKALIGMAVVAAMAFDTRYAGITFIATGEILLFFDRQLKWKQKTSHLLIFGIIGCSMAVINLVHNIIATGLLTGKRQKGITPLTDNIAYSGNVLTDWTSLSGHSHLFFVIIGIAILAIFTWIFVKNTLKNQDYHSFENSVTAFFIVYIGFIILSSTFSRYEKINNRLLSAAFLPFLWGITYKLPGWIRALRHKRHKWGLGIICIVIAVAIYANYYSINIENYSYMHESGIPGYTEDSWRQSPTIRFLQHNHIYFNNDSTVYSNHNQAVYFYTSHPVDMVPERVYKEDVRMFDEESPIVLIWFFNDPNSDILNLKEIRQRKTLRPLHTFSDGVIYLCINKDTLTVR